MWDTNIPSSQSNIDSKKEFILFNMDKNNNIENSQNLVKILVRDWLAKIPENLDIETLSPEKIEKHIIKLLDKWKITYSDYVKYYIESWAIMLWEYLVLEWLIKSEELILAKKIQEQQKTDKAGWYIAIVDLLWEILIKEGFITNEKLNDAMEKLWIDTQEFYELK